MRGKKRIRILAILALSCVLPACNVDLTGPGPHGSGPSCFMGGCSGGFGGGAPSSPPDLTVDVRIHIDGELLAGYQVDPRPHVLIVHPADPARILEQAEWDPSVHPQAVRFELYGQHDALDTLCAAELVAILGNGVVSEPVPVQPVAGSCSGRIERRIDVPGTEPDVRIWGDVVDMASFEGDGSGGHDEGLLELYLPDSPSGSPIARTWFLAERFDSPDYEIWGHADYTVAAREILPDDSAERACELEARVVLSDGRMSERVPLIEDDSVPCVGLVRGTPLEVPVAQES